MSEHSFNLRFIQILLVKRLVKPGSAFFFHLGGGTQVDARKKIVCAEQV